MRYTTQHLYRLFKVSHQTIKNWSTEFEAFLSPSARPGRNRQRQFTDEDLEVFALIAQMKSAGAIYDDIHAALAAGQRGIVPDTLELMATPAAAQAGLLMLRQQVVSLTTALEQSMRDNARQQGQIDLLKEQLAEAQKKIDALTMQIGAYKTRITDD